MKAVNSTIRDLFRDFENVENGCSKIFDGEARRYLQEAALREPFEELELEGVDEVEGCHIVYLRGAAKTCEKLQRGLEAHLWDKYGIACYVLTQW